MKNLFIASILSLLLQALSTLCGFNDNSPTVLDNSTKTDVKYTDSGDEEDEDDDVYGEGYELKGI